MKNISGLLLMGCSALALAGCGADDVASPGNDNLVINNPTVPAPTPTPGTGLVVAAASCPTFAATGGLKDDNTITGPEGTWRICTLPALIDKSASLPKVPGVVYRINGRVDVGCDGGFRAPTAAAPFTTTTATCASRSLPADTNVTLTVDPGVIVYGENTAEAAWLAVNRGNKINAEGTPTNPIIFTSRQNITGAVNESSSGQWGGIVLLGRGIVTDCNYGSTGASTCERDTEGAVAKAVFGGLNNAYNAGVMKYVQIRYSGYLLSEGKELQALTTGGIGSETILDYIQSVNSSDDGAEFFGGKVQMKHYIAVNADDDSLDIDTGLEGYFQYVLLLQKSGQGDALMEIDSNGLEAQTPRQKTIIANFTAIQPASSSNNESNDQASVLVRGNSDITWVNGIVASPNNECLRVHGTSESGSAPATLKAYTTVLSCNAGKFVSSGSYAGTTTAASMFATGTNRNNDAFTSTLMSTFVNGTNETGVAGYADIKTLSSFFDTTAYIGAVKDSSDTWYKGWTCNTTTGAFGSPLACSVLPTT